MPSEMIAPEVRITITGVEELAAMYRDLDETQLPFATALTLTTLAKISQDNVRGSLGQRFTIRRSAWIQSKVKVQAATKSQLQAAVVFDFFAMVRQEEGGDKLPYGGGSAIAVPLSGARPTASALIAAKDRPKRVMENGGFIRDGIMYAVPRRARLGRVGWKKGRQGPQPLAVQGPIRPVAMYVLKPKVSVKPRLEMDKTVASTVRRMLEPTFQFAAARAIATAKR